VLITQMTVAWYRVKVLIVLRAEKTLFNESHHSRMVDTKLTCGCHTVTMKTSCHTIFLFKFSEK
jgi:hypothetical protein